MFQIDVLTEKTIECLLWKNVNPFEINFNMTVPYKRFLGK